MIPAAVKERESAYGRAVGSAGGLETTRPSLDSTARNTNDELRVLVEIGFLASQGRFDRLLCLESALRWLAVGCGRPLTA